MMGPEMKLSTLSLDHLGLVAAIFDALGISEVIDELIPKTRDCKLSHSAIIKALIINGLESCMEISKINPIEVKRMCWATLAGK
jgi:transposase